MRLISMKAAKAFVNNYKFTKSNTQVRTYPQTALYLFGNKIAWKDDTGVYFTLCGWPTRTTTERLNTLLSFYNHNKIVIKQGSAYYNGNEISSTGSYKI